MFETCPLLDQIDWIRHGFYDSTNPCADAKKLVGVQTFNEEFPEALFLRQQHTDRFVSNVEETGTPADASITSKDNLALAVKTADCCPVLIVCTETKQIAAIHAGWPGALNRITAKTIQGMIDNGANPKSMIAAIGPSVHQETFPVQDDVRDKFPSETMKFFIPFEDRWKMDVAGIVRQQIEQAGIEQIWQSSINTFTNKNYYSYRRFTNGLSPDYASNISIIKIIAE
jgi:YfiH family protein